MTMHPDGMTDDMFNHHLVLAAIIISGMRETTNDEFVEWVQDDASSNDLFNHHSSDLILAATCVELMRRAGIKPKMPFPVQAKSEAAA